MFEGCGDFFSKMIYLYFTRYTWWKVAFFLNDRVSRLWAFPVSVVDQWPTSQQRSSSFLCAWLRLLFGWLQLLQGAIGSRLSLNVRKSMTISSRTKVCHLCFTVTLLRVTASNRYWPFTLKERCSLTTHRLQGVVDYSAESERFLTLESDQVVFHPFLICGNTNHKLFFLSKPFITHNHRQMEKYTSWLYWVIFLMPQWWLMILSFS